MSVIVQASSIGSFGGSRTPTGVTLNGVAQGNSLIMAVACGEFVSTAPALTVSDGASYTADQYTAYAPGGSRYGAGIFRRHNVNSGNYTAAPTAAVGTAPGGRFKLFEVSGLENSAADKAVGTGTSSNSPATGSTGALTQANNFALAIMFANVGGIDPASDSFVNSYLDNAGAEGFVSIDYKYVAATTAINLNWGTLSSSDHWLCAMAVYKDAAGGGRLIGGPLVGGVIQLGGVLVG